MQPTLTNLFITFFILALASVSLRRRAVDVAFIVRCLLVVVDILLILHKELVEILASIVVGSVVDDLFAQTVLQRLHRLPSCIIVIKIGMNVVVQAQQVR